MPANQPFQPNNGATAGKTIKVAANSSPTSVPSSVDNRVQPAPSIQVANTGTVLVFVRMSSEATPVATAADMPVGAGITRTFTNPVPYGLLGIAALSSAATACDVYFTPGNGGI